MTVTDTIDAAAMSKASAARKTPETIILLPGRLTNVVRSSNVVLLGTPVDVVGTPVEMV